MGGPREEEGEEGYLEEGHDEKGTTQAGRPARVVHDESCSSSSSPPLPTTSEPSLRELHQLGPSGLLTG